MKILLILLLTLSFLNAKKLKEPQARFIASGSVVDLFYENSKIYAATDAGSVDIFSIDSKKVLQRIQLSKITDFMGDEIDSKIYSVDKIGKSILILSQAQKGARRVHVYKDNVNELIIPYTEKLFIAKAKFLNEHTILMALLSNELISFDIIKKKINYKIQVSQSKFSNFVLNEQKNEVVVCDESGDLKLHNTNDGSFIKTLSGKNLDNVFQVDYKNGLIATAGQDRRIVIYNTKTSSSYYKTSSFLIYSVGLSKDATLVGYSCDENNNICVFNTHTQQEIAKYGGNKMTLTNIIFVNKNQFLSASDDKSINLYTIK